jgi:hypothetical protein
VSDGLFQDGLAVDSQGNVYGSDYAGDSVFKYDVVTEVVTTYQTGFITPNGIGIDPQDQVYICDHMGGKIYKYDANGALLDVFSGLVTPAGIKNIPGTNDMLFVSYNENSISELLEDGTINELYSGTLLNGPAGIAFINEEIYIGNYNNRGIFKYESGTLTFVAQLPATAPTQNVLGFLSALDGKLIATQIGENKIYRIDPDSGEVILLAGSSQGAMDGPLSEATFHFPNGIVGDMTRQRIYISDAIPKNLRIIEGITLGVPVVSFEKIEIVLAPNPPNDTITLSGGLIDVKYHII